MRRRLYFRRSSFLTAALLSFVCRWWVWVLARGLWTAHSLLSTGERGGLTFTQENAMLTTAAQIKLFMEEFKNG